MKRIDLKDYRYSMGTLINLEDSATHLECQIPTKTKNIPYETLIMNYKQLLDKDKPYYLYCKMGRKSRRAASILELYGYDVTQVYT